MFVRRHLVFLGLSLVLLAPASPVTAQVSDDEAAALFIAEDYEALRQRRLRGAEERLSLERHKLRPGLVYKKPRFWSAYPGFDIGRNLFEGDFSAVDARAFKTFYVDYLRTFSGVCRNVLAERSHRVFDVTSQSGRYRSDGSFEVLGPKRKVGEVWVESRFADHYSEFLDEPDYEEASGGILDALAKAFLLGEPADLVGVPGNLLEQTQAKLRMILSSRAFNQECRSPRVAQLQENLYRFARGLPSLQVAGGSVSGAAGASDPLPSPWEMVTLQESCADFHLNRSLDWCACIAPILEPLLPPAELAHYTGNFAALQARLGTEGSRERRAIGRCLQ